MARVEHADFRSYQNEVRRSEELTRRMLDMKHTQFVIDRVASSAGEIHRNINGMWKGGREPLPFDEFCVALDGYPMFPRQVDVWDKSNILRAAQLFDPNRTITEELIIWGKGSGKDMQSSKFMCYFIYCLHHLAEGPAAYMTRVGRRTVATNTRLDIVNVAPNADLAKQVFFNYMKSYLSTPVMAQFVMDPPPRKWKNGTDHIVFPEINLHLYSKTSKSSGLDGFNLIAWIMDEADDFFDGAKRSNAEAIHKIFRRTGVGRFGNFTMGVIISYPRLEDGFVLRSKKEFEESNRISDDAGEGHMYFIDLAPTSEVRPDFDMNEPAIRNEFRIDPKGANAMYNCHPMAAEDVFFDDGAALVLEAQSDSDSRPFCADVTQIYPIHRDNSGKSFEYVCAAVQNIERASGVAYFLAIDGGLSGDSYGVCVGHIDDTSASYPWLCPSCGRSYPQLRNSGLYRQLEHSEPLELGKDGRAINALVCGNCFADPGLRGVLNGNRGWWKKESTPGHSIEVDGKPIRLPHFYEDLLIEVKPEVDPRPGYPTKKVYFPGMEAIVQTLHDELGIIQIRTDPWQTIQMIQSVRSTGADIDLISMGTKDQLQRALLYKICLNHHLLSLRPNETRDKEVRQLQRTGNKIDHPKINGGKDMFDCESMCLWIASIYHDPGLQAYFGGVVGINPEAKER